MAHLIVKALANLWRGGAIVSSALDHPRHVSFAVAGQHIYHPVTVGDVSPIAISFPTFEAILNDLQAQND
jgi:3-phosphoshikimate 1-carboxyvinyltransferase